MSGSIPFLIFRFQQITAKRERQDILKKSDELLKYPEMKLQVLKAHKEILVQLVQGLDSNDENTRNHSAQTLILFKDKPGLLFAALLDKLNEEDEKGQEGLVREIIIPAGLLDRYNNVNYPTLSDGAS